VKILIVEDNSKLADGIKQFLESCGHVVDVAPDIATAEAALAVQVFDVMVLDRTLPDGDGLSLLKNLKSGHAAPRVLILSARGEAQDRIAGLNVGADDYISKPFSVEELQARVLAVSRRGSKHGTTYEIGGLVFDTITKATMIAGSIVQLAPRESAVLEILLRRKGSVVSKEQIINGLSNFDQEVSENAVEQSVSRLRARLNPIEVSISTVRGIGYYLVAEE
jgi:two-component system OmpR family response regulator